MGRKIPAKKHRGVKDPLEQQARRFQSIKGKINAPPTDPDEQPVPRSLQRLFSPFAPAAPSNPRPNKHKQGNRNQGGDSRAKGGNVVSRLRALPGESAREFSRRITGATRALLGGGPLNHPGEDDEEEEDSKGARMADLRERRARKQRRAANGRPAVPAEPAPPKLSKTHKLALKKQAKKDKANEKSVERREVQFERVPFGEVAHAPPALRPVRGKAAATGAARPGRRGLLLSALLPGGGAAAAPPAAEARRLERARADAVAAYRALKAERAKKQHT